MEKSWAIMKDRTDKISDYTRSRRKLVPQVRCGIGLPEGAICDLETGV